MPYLNVVDPAFSFTAPEVFAAQDAGWFADSPVGPIVLRYAETSALLRDKRLDHGGDGYLRQFGITSGPIHDWWVPMLVNHDGADHRRLRGLVGRSFTPRTVEGLRPFIRAQASSLADQVDGADFVDTFANRLPLAVMCALLGVPAEDYDTFSVWTSDIGLIFGLAAGGDTADRVSRAVAGLDGYVDALIDEKAARPADDLISSMVRTWRADRTVTRAELRNLLVTLVFGAHDNTRHQFANTMVTFAEHPGQWQVLRDNPGLAANAVTEAMRWRPSAATVFRRVASDFEFDGTPLAAGTFLTMAVQAAQRDPRAYPGGSTFDITATREAPLLQFGAGPHYCLGSALAHAELEEALPILARRFGAPEITADLTWRPAIGIHGPEALPLRFAGPAGPSDPAVTGS